jgi:hypothetical protein
VLLAQRCWAWAPVRRMPLQHRHHWRRALPMTRRDLGRADLARARRAVPRTTARADLADMARAILVARAGPGTSTRTEPVARADPAVPETSTRTDPVVRETSTRTAQVVRETSTRTAQVVPETSTRTAQVVRADLVAHGMEMPSVAISAGPHGVTDPHRGDRVRPRGPRGTDRFHRPAGSGGMAQSTTGATRKRPFGTPGSTRGASGSSGSGSRCKEASSHGARLATRRGGRRRRRDGRAVLRSQAVLP